MGGSASRDLQTSIRGFPFKALSPRSTSGSIRHFRAAMNGKTQPTRVLFVDDSPEFLEFVRQALTPWSSGKWEMMLTHDASEVFAAMATKQFDMVVTDLAMRGTMDGLQLIKV